MESIVGKTFGRLTVVEVVDVRSKKGEIQCRCVCFCGESVIIPRTRIVCNMTKSCGCLLRESRSISRPIKYLRVNNSILDPLTEDVSYFLGFFCADGNISKSNKYQATLCIQRRDEYLLKEFVELLQINNPVRKITSSYSYKGKIKTSEASSLVIHDKSFVEFLEGFGITAKKSFTLKFPKNIPQELIRHYVRGYWDGNGSINISKHAGVKDMNIIVCSASKSFIEDLKSWLDDQSIKCGEFYFCNNTYSFRISTRNNNVHNFYKLLYLDENICLSRKRKALEEILEYIRSSRKSKHSRIIGELL